MTYAEHFLLLARLADVDEDDFALAFGVTQICHDYDDDLAVWAGSPRNALEIIAYANVLSCWVDDEHADTIETIRPVWMNCVEEQPSLRQEWIDHIPAYDVFGRLLGRAR